MKWLKLKKICQEICNKKVHIHSSTDMPNNHIAGAEFDNKEVNIILNMQYTKTKNDIIKAIAHEITHVLKNSNEHTVDFEDEWRKNEEQIIKKYDEIK